MPIANAPNADSTASENEEYVIAPEDLSGEFPSPVTANFNTIKKAKYKMTNPMRFAKRFGQFNREEILKNYELAKSLALQQLDTELQGLDKYAPAAAALKRSEISADNLFNQQQRSAQIASTMPGVAGWLADQADRANAYAQGRVPDSITDRALELNMRSASADRSTAAGFGASSSVARKASDLMSAEKRIQLSQYGDQLLGQNIQTTANLMLAPTEYSDAGAQIRVMPEIGGARLSAGALSEINQITGLPTSSAFQGRVQQQQFLTNLKQQTRMFNAQGEWNESSFNANTANQFALKKFDYKAQLAGVMAGVETANNMIGLGLSQQAQYGQIFQDAMGASQSAGETAAVSGGIGSLIPQIPGMVNSIAGMFSPNNTPSDTNADGTANILGSDLGPEGSNITFGTDGGSINGHPIEAGGDTSSVDTSGGFSAAPDYGPAPSLITPDMYPQDYSSSNYNLKGAGAGGYTGPSGLWGGQTNLQPGQPGYQFQAATGLTVHPSMPGSTAAVLGAAGVSRDPNTIAKPVNVGSGYDGNPIFSSAVLQAGMDTGAGNKWVTTLGAILAPFGAFPEEDYQTLNQIGAAASDPAALDNLVANANKGDAQMFINSALGLFGKGPIESITKDKDKNALMAANAAYEGMQALPKISPEQRSLLVAGLGLKASDFNGKQSLGEAIVPTTVKPGTKPVTIGKTLEWFGKGINAYPLTKKWDQFSTLSKLITGNNSPDTVATVASQFNLLGAGVNGAEVPGVTEASLAKAGWTPMTHLGVGAVAGKQGAVVPAGYTEVGNTNGLRIAAPRGTAYTAQGAIGGASQSGLRGSNLSPRDPRLPNLSPGTANALNWSVGAYNIYNMWNRKPGTASALGTAQVVGSNVDAYNKQQAIENKDPSQISGYGAAAGSAMSAYNAYLAAKKGDEAAATGHGTQASFLAAQAYYTEMGDTAAAQAMGQYAGYAGAGVNMINAYNQWKAGNKEGAGASTVAAGASLYHPGAGLAVAGAYQSYKGWGSGSAKNGAIGGSMMLAGMAMMGMPLVGAGLMAVSVLGNMAKTGKPGDQNARDGIREAWQKNGFLVDKDYNVTLADGTLFNIGQDGHSGEHDPANPEMLTDGTLGSGHNTGKMHSYDIDYTNDLDFVSGMQGTTLTRLLFGEKAKNIDQIGGQLGNAALGNVGYGQAMTKENFDKTQANMRAFYAKAGIGSKQDAYQLANSAFAEGRISESDMLTMHQSINMMFDEDGYDLAQKLMAGRNNGVKAAFDVANSDKTDDNTRPTSSETGAAVAGVAGNLAQSMSPTANAFTGKETSPGIIAPNYEGMGFQNWGVNAPPVPATSQSQMLRLTKDQVQARNQARYAGETYV